MRNTVITECHGSNAEQLIAKKTIRRNGIFYKILRFFEKNDWNLADGIVAINKETKKMLVDNEIDSSKIFISSDGVNTKLFNSNINGDEIRKRYGITNDFVMIYIGSFRIWHGIDNLLLVLKRLIQKNHDVKLLLIGDGPERKKMGKLAKELSIEKNTIFIDYIPHNEISKYIAAADICPYYPPSPSQKNTRSFSGTPIKFYEYLAMGKTIITTNEPEFLFLKDYECGLLLKNDIHDFVSRIMFLYENKDEIKKMGKNGIRFIQQNKSWDNVVSQIDEFISQYSN